MRSAYTLLLQTMFDAVLDSPGTPRARQTLRPRLAAAAAQTPARFRRERNFCVENLSSVEARTLPGWPVAARLGDVGGHISVVLIRSTNCITRVITCEEMQQGSTPTMPGYHQRRVRSRLKAKAHAVRRDCTPPARATCTTAAGEDEGLSGVGNAKSASWAGTVVGGSTCG